jgi:hypothetical protein
MAPDHVKDSFYLRAMRTGIGVALRERYAANEPLTERLAKLLKELDEAETKARPKTTPGNAPSRSESTAKK